MQNTTLPFFLSSALDDTDESIKSALKRYPFGIQDQSTIEKLSVHVVKFREKLVFFCFYKEHHWEKCTYKDLFTILSNLKSTLVEHNVTSFSMPRIGETHDGLQWEQIRSMIRYLFKPTGLIVNIFHNILISPETDEIDNVIKSFHDGPGNGHPGLHKTYHRIKQTYKWKNMRKDITKYVKNCKSCQTNKIKRKTKMPLEIKTTSRKPFEKIFLDVVGPLPMSENGNKYILLYRTI